MSLLVKLAIIGVISSSLVFSSCTSQEERLRQQEERLRQFWIECEQKKKQE